MKFVTTPSDIYNCSEAHLIHVPHKILKKMVELDHPEIQLLPQGGLVCHGSVTPLLQMNSRVKRTLDCLNWGRTPHLCCEIRS